MVDDLRCSMRSLWRERGHAAAVVLILAAGIGIVTSVFTVYSALFLRPLPLDEPERLVVVRRQDPSGDFLRLDGSAYAFLRDNGNPFESFAAVTEETAAMEAGGRTENVRVLSVADEYFAVLRVAPEHGGVFRAGEGADAGDAVIVLGHDAARRAFGSAPAAVGRSAVVNGRSRLVVGVMAEDFARLADVEAWIPGDPEAPSQARSFRYLGLGRLHPDVDQAAAQARLDVAGSAFLRQAPEMEQRFVRFHVRSYQDYLARGFRGVLILLLTAVGLILLVSCVNGASLVLARGLARRAEFVTRLVLGAAPWRIVRLILVENLLLACGAGVVGCVAAVVGVRVFLLLDAGRFASWQVAVDARVLSFALAVSCAAGVACGVAPAMRCARANLQGTLRAQDRGFSSRRQAPWLRRGMVVGQMGASFILVVLAVLFLRTTLDAARVDPGFDSRNVLTAATSLAAHGFDGPEEAGNFFAEGVRRLQASPAVEAAAVVSSLPGLRSVNVPHATSAGANDLVNVDWRYVTPEYFETMRIPRRRGRDFSRFDRPRAPAVAVVNEAFAARYHRGRDVIGERIRIHPAIPALTDRWREIVGVAGDVVGRGKEPERPAVYVPVAQAPPELLQLVHGFTAANWVVRIGPGGAPPGWPGEAAEELRELDRQAPLSEWRSMDEVIAVSLRDRRVQTALLGTLSLFAVALTAGGVHGLLSFAVAVRAREFGVRLAVGASGARVLARVVVEGIGFAAVGSVAGGGLWLLARPVLRSFLPGSTGMEPAALALGAVILAGVAAVSAVIPSLQLVRRQPVHFLRQ